ncbi:VOC family protein [Brevibacillus dissolubilis]|uniref:VOC family protein n=1 Tax=Brevibacillus dissolubilis TaxID=1844116 RepID=UPI0011164B0F|nr:VOC family protein [Brevibacillus dissolubilis]
MRVKGFNHITIRVSDLERSLSFYEGVLQMELVHRGRTDAYLDWGGAWVCLIEKQDLVQMDEHILGVDHVAFSVEDDDFDEAVAILMKHEVPVVRGPIERGLGKTINFLDPDGTQLELYTSNLQRRMTVWK